MIKNAYKNFVVLYLICFSIVIILVNFIIYQLFEGIWNRKRDKKDVKAAFTSLSFKLLKSLKIGWQNILVIIETLKMLIIKPCFTIFFYWIFLIVNKKTFS